MVTKYGFVTGQDGCGQPRFCPVLDTHKGNTFVLATDYAKLEAENVELKKQCAAFHAEASGHYRASTAATATLDALRDLFAPDKVISNSTCMKAVDILYPTPENDK